MFMMRPVVFLYWKRHYEFFEILIRVRRIFRLVVAAVYAKFVFRLIIYTRLKPLRGKGNVFFFNSVWNDTCTELFYYLINYTLVKSLLYPQGTGLVYEIGKYTSYLTNRLCRTNKIEFSRKI